MFAWLKGLLARRLVRPGDAPGKDELGRLSERTARTFLERAGFSIVAANYRCPLGEIDLVAEGQGRLVFVEVKGRRLAADGSQASRPESAVTRDKQRKIGRSAKYFCRRHRRYRGWTVRFDVIAIDWPAEGQSGDPVIRHHAAAFRPDV
ncbi:MAG: hypothetical protein BIFFINMI_02217 [Phycisphaerae bacterium]|nr:hypothetical protein [Phycisphaerae bacterium]